ncbi:hypothetical protein ACA910_017931 [Epithemia clementina (nom. ined.)]
MKSLKSDYARPSPQRRRKSGPMPKSHKFSIGAIVLLACGSMFGSIDNKNQLISSASDRAACLLRSAQRSLLAKQMDEPVGLYKPAMVEEYIYNNQDTLGYNPADGETSEGCKIWNDPAASSIYNELHAYREEIVKYWEAVEKSSWIKDHGIQDVRKHLRKGICRHLELDAPKGKDLQEAFFPSGQLSYTNASGWIEPLTPPMRHPNFCMRKSGNILNTKCLVHNFAAMCRKLTRTSRIVLFDLGASPKFAGASSPMWKIVNLFEQFGFKFDHIYAFEIKHFTAEDVYQMVPRHLQPAYHWINAGVSTEEGHNLNPWTMLENEFTEEDLVIVKLDIDTASLEVPLAHQLLNNPKLWNLVDQFYFEHHVRQEENTFWRNSWGGTIKDTLELFHGLRTRGIPTHFWV